MINGEVTQRSYVPDFTSCCWKEEEWGNGEALPVFMGVAVALGACGKTGLVKHPMSFITTQLEDGVG